MRSCLILSLVLPAVLAPAAFAQGPTPAGYNEAMIKGGGQIDALGIVCGKASEAQARARKARLKQSFAARGVAPATFETLYNGGFEQVKATAKANPVEAKRGCDRLAREARAGR